GNANSRNRDGSRADSTCAGPHVKGLAVDLLDNSLGRLEVSSVQIEVHPGVERWQEERARAHLLCQTCTDGFQRQRYRRIFSAGQGKRSLEVDRIISEPRRHSGASLLAAALVPWFRSQYRLGNG